MTEGERTWTAARREPGERLRVLRRGAHRDRGDAEGPGRRRGRGPRGRPSEDQTKAFLAAGYEKRQVLEVVLGVGLKTLSNYTNHIAGTALDAAFAKAAWSKEACACR